jgi:PAS domain S-box-containing protein
MNSVAERLTGWIQADALGKPLDEMFNIIHEETRQSVENPVVKVLGEGVVVELANHTALLTKDGREIPIEDSGAPIRDADGAILGVVLVFRDATQKHQIQETRARLAAIVEGSDDAIISKNLDGVITSWNQGAERMYGYTATEAVGQPITMLIPPHRPDEEAAILERLKRGERVDHFETQRMHRDGTLLDVSLTVSPIYNALGQVNGASKIARDVTERKRAERELREITEFYRQLQEQLTRLVEASSHLLSSLNLNHILPTILDMAHQLVAADMYAIWRFFSDTKEWRIIGEVGLSEEFKRMTLPGSGNEPLHSPMLAEDINAFPMLASRREIYTKEGIRSLLVLPLRIYGQTSGTMVFYWREKKQFTELQVRVATAFANIVGAAVGSAELYEEQQQLRLQAQQAVQDRDEFLSVAAHELKTPITSMRGFTQLHLRRLEKSGAVDLEALKRSLLVVDKQAGKLTQLVDQLLDLARIEAGKLTLEPELIDVVKLVQDTVDSIQPNTEQHLITVHAPAQLGAVVDPIRFEQVVTNLLNNALKYSPKGGPVEIVLSGPTPDAFTLSITDQGIGIPPEQRERIFDRFYQAHAGLHFGGIGLGLYISRQIIELHGGMIHVEHPEAGGTRFVIELPK